VVLIVLFPLDVVIGQKWCVDSILVVRMGEEEKERRSRKLHVYLHALVHADVKTTNVAAMS
jgi:hypothetical protein